MNHILFLWKIFISPNRHLLRHSYIQVPHIHHSPATVHSHNYPVPPQKGSLKSGYICGSNNLLNLYRNKQDPHFHSADISFELLLHICLKKLKILTFLAKKQFFLYSATLKICLSCLNRFKTA